jgi:uncharacterized membrane protein (UPF0127 family)
MNPLQWIAKGVRDFLVPHQPEAENLPRRVVNLTRGCALATQLEVAGSGSTRRKGLLGRDGLLPGEGLWIVPCESVHTFFMRFPIDLIYLDRKNCVKKVRHAVGAWRISVCFTAHSVLELPAGTIRDSLTEKGDVLELSTASPLNDTTGAS